MEKRVFRRGARSALIAIAMVSCSDRNTTKPLTHLSHVHGHTATPLGETSTASEAQLARTPKLQVCGLALQGAPRRLDVTELEGHRVVTVKVFNPYTQATETYGGVLLRDLVQQFAPSAQTVDLSAIDDYQVQFSAKEWTTQQIILATQANGKYMTVTDKGPARIVIQIPKSKTAAIAKMKPKWVWQIVKIEFNK